MPLSNDVFYENFRYNDTDFNNLFSTYRATCDEIIKNLRNIENNLILTKMETYRIIPRQYMRIGGARYDINTIISEFSEDTKQSVKNRLNGNIPQIKSEKYYNTRNTVPSDDNMFTFVSNGDGTCNITHIKVSELNGDIVIPYKSKNGETVVSFENSLTGNTELNSIVLPNTIKEIPEGSFSGCINLKKVDLPYGIKKINSYAFFNCQRLCDIEIPDTVTEIHEGAFSGCSSIESIVLPRYLNILKEYSFQGCINLKNVQLSDEYLEKINIGTFMDCSSLRAINLGNNITTIDDYAFYNCASLENIAISKNWTKIGVSAFENCYNLTQTLYIPHSTALVSTIESYAFHKSGIQKLVFENSKENDNRCSVLDNAFKACKNLEQIYIPDDRTVYFGDSELPLDSQDTFRDCTALTEVYFGANIAYLPKGILEIDDTSTIPSITFYIGNPNLIVYGKDMSNEMSINFNTLIKSTIHMPNGQSEVTELYAHDNYCYFAREDEDVNNSFVDQDQLNIDGVTLSLRDYLGSHGRPLDFQDIVNEPEYIPYTYLRYENQERLYEDTYPLPVYAYNTQSVMSNGELVKILGAKSKYIEFVLDRSMILDEPKYKIVSFELYDSNGKFLIPGVDYEFSDNRIYLFGDYAKIQSSEKPFELRNIAIDMHIVEDSIGENLKLKKPDDVPKTEFIRILKELTKASIKGPVLSGANYAIDQAFSTSPQDAGNASVEILDICSQGAETKDIFKKHSLTTFDFVLYIKEGSVNTSVLSLYTQYLKKIKLAETDFITVLHGQIIENLLDYRDYCQNFLSDEYTEDMDIVFRSNVPIILNEDNEHTNNEDYALLGGEGFETHSMCDSYEDQFDSESET